MAHNYEHRSAHAYMCLCICVKCVYVYPCAIERKTLSAFFPVVVLA